LEERANGGASFPGKEAISHAKVDLSVLHIPLEWNPRLTPHEKGDESMNSAKIIGAPVHRTERL
jgi:hypothetical protein